MPEVCPRLVRAGARMRRERLFDCRAIGRSCRRGRVRRNRSFKRRTISCLTNPTGGAIPPFLPRLRPKSFVRPSISSKTTVPASTMAKKGRSIRSISCSMTPRANPLPKTSWTSGMATGTWSPAHFVVGRDGSIVQCVPLDRIAHHAGFGDAGHNAQFGVEDESRDDKRASFPIGDWAPDYGMNSHSVGIELVHVGGAGEYPQPSWRRSMPSSPTSTPTTDLKAQSPTTKPGVPAIPTPPPNSPPT